ncbi:MAG: NusG domain II-containing protein [Bacilli bacterium]|nr:NusG domain II-containing protein [Bacilli bacterium]
MNKYDIRLIGIVLVIILLILFFTRKDNNYANVYYNDKLILKIDLSIDKEYSVNGYNGIVKLKVKDNKIKVMEETSKMHICSKVDWTNSGVIVCLPNKIVINFSNDELDTVSG